MDSLVLSHPVLRQALRQKHQEAQQACRPHNLPMLQAAQQREQEVGVRALLTGHGGGAQGGSGAAGGPLSSCMWLFTWGVGVCQDQAETMRSPPPVP